MSTDLILYLCIAAAGVVVGYLLSQSRNGQRVSQSHFKSVEDEVARLKIELASCLTKSQVAQGYVVKEWFVQCNTELAALKEIVQQKEKQLLGLTAEAEQKMS